MRWTELSLQCSSRKWECPTEKHNTWPGPANPVLMLGFQGECNQTYILCNNIIFFHKVLPASQKPARRYTIKWQSQILSLKISPTCPVHQTRCLYRRCLTGFEKFQIWRFSAWVVETATACRKSSMSLAEGYYHFCICSSLVKARKFLPDQPFCNISIQSIFLTMSIPAHNVE